MRKLLIVLGLTLLLASCSTQPTVEETVTIAFGRPLPSGTNTSKTYFRYYLPYNVGLSESTPVSSLINVEGDRLMLQLNVSEIIRHKYYQDETLETIDFVLINTDNLGENVQELSNQYMDHLDQEQTYHLVYFDENGHRTLILKNRLVELIAIVPIPAADHMLETMITIMRSVEVDEDQVVDTFSNKEIIEYNDPINEQFFEVAIPEDGTLLDMYNRLHPDDPLSSEPKPES